ncbi:MAG TPA: hypothetical protein VHB54_01785 [Mucilaginibacter sp.]|nr:hypothetical protein [Mucilaginibacter sp.]
MKKVYLILLLGLFGQAVKAQNLLNLNKAQIKKYMATRHAILKGDDAYASVFGMPPLIDLDYDFPDSLRSKDGIFRITFYFTKTGKCYKYYTIYTSDKFLPKIVDDLNNTKSGLKKLSKDQFGLIRLKGMTWKLNVQDLTIERTSRNIQSSQ